MRKIMIIGIGAGDPDYITMQAIKAMQQASVFFVTDKGPAKEDLLRIRTAICERYLAECSYRIVPIQDPERDRLVADYRTAVHRWHEQRRAIYQQLILDELDEDGCGAFLVWGDPSLYDSTLRIIEQIAASHAVAIDYQVIPGISSVQALAARHRIALNRIGEPVEITTGRQLAAAPVVDEHDLVVLLDGDCAFSQVQQENVDIYWAAYLGTAEELLVSGRLQDTSAPIQRLRAEARARKGWIMDTYLLRKSRSAPD